MKNVLSKLKIYFWKMYLNRIELNLYFDRCSGKDLIEEQEYVLHKIRELRASL